MHAGVVGSTAGEMIQSQIPDLYVSLIRLALGIELLRKEKISCKKCGFVLALLSRVRVAGGQSKYRRRMRIES